MFDHTQNMKHESIDIPMTYDVVSICEPRTERGPIFLRRRDVSDVNCECE